MISDNNVIHQGEWLAVPDIMERTGRSLPTVRTWLQERDLIGMRRGPNNALMVPSAFVTDQGPLKALRGTLSVLSDSGLNDEEILTWLGEKDDTLLGGSPIGALEGGHKTEIRRRAQELAI
ncbi:MAG: Rv2175c family DNA-binding protein [Ornithinimicrobium sp.]